MNSTIRKALPFVLLALLAATGLPLSAQLTDCAATFSFTTDATQTGVSNLSGQTPCVNWRVTYSVTGTLTSTVTFQTSPDNAVWTSVPNSICSASTQPPCVIQGANPLTGTTQGMSYFSAYGAWVRVITTGSAGAGTGTVRMYGAKGATANAGGAVGSGGGTVTSVGLQGTANQITITGASPIVTSGTWTVSLSSPLILPGQLGVGTAGRTGNTNPQQNISEWGGNIEVANPATLGAESLTNGALTAGASWSVTGDFALAANAATYTHAAGGGTLTQAAVGLAVAGVGNRWYKFVYSVSAVTAGMTACSITTTFADNTFGTSFDITAGAAKVFYFKSATTPGAFVISCTSTAGGLTFDDLSLKEVQGGNLIISGLVSGGGANGLKVASNGSVSVPNVGGTLLPLQNAAFIKPCVIVIGDPSAASPVLADDNDSPVACGNSWGSDWTITSVACWANAGSPTVTPILTAGAATSILTGALTCGTGAWAPGTVNGTPVLHTFSADGSTCASTPCTADVDITTAGGVAKYIVVRIVGTL